MNELLLEKIIDIKNFAHKEIFKNVLYLWDVLSFLEEYIKKCSLGKIETDIPSGVHLINPELISIGKGTVVEKGAYIKGPCVIGKNCQIRNGAYIRENVLTGDNCIIGHCVEIKNSIILNNTNIAHFSYIGDSVLGNNVNLGAGVKCANVRLDKKEIKLFIKDVEVGTGLKKVGALIGDNTQIGCNAVLNPATIIGKNVKCFPCINISGNIEAGTTVK